MTRLESQSPEAAIRLILFIAAVGVCVSAAEELRRRDLFSKTGLLSWSVLMFTRRPPRYLAFQRLEDRLFSPRAFSVILCLKLLTAACLAASVALCPGAFLISGVLSGLVLTNLLLLKRRTSFGLDGSDHMNIVI